MKSKHTEITQDVASTRTIQRIDAQIEKIEDLIEQLLTGIDLAKLTANQRLTLVTRFMALSQRSIAIRQTWLTAQPENGEALLISQFMAYMRGESSQDTVLMMEPSQGSEES